MKGYLKWTSILLALLLIVFLGIKTGFLSINSPFGIDHQEKKDSAIITERVENLCNLATVKYNYQEILDYSDSVKLGEVELPFGMGEKKVLITYRAHVTGGCKFISLEKQSDNQVKVRLGEGQVLDNVLELDSINIYDMQQGMFNKFNLGDDTVLINEDMKKYAEENRKEITAAAEENAAGLVKGFLQSLGFESVEIVFEPQL